MLDTNTLIDTQSPTDATGLYSFMDPDVLVLSGRLVYFPYRQNVNMVRLKSSKRFGRTPLVAMS